MTRSPFARSLAAALLASSGCGLLVSYEGFEAGTSGGKGGAGAAGGAGGGGGSADGGGGGAEGGGRPCTDVAECPEPKNECVLVTCDGRCHVDNAEKGTATKDQTAADCRKNVCDGEGALTFEVDEDDNDDENPCTKDSCVDGQVVHEGKPGEDCGVGQVCSTSGDGCCTPDTEDEVCAGKDCTATDNCGQTVLCGYCNNATCGNVDAICRCVTEPCSLWSRLFEGAESTDSAFVDAMAIDGDGNILLTGSFTGRLVFDNEVLETAGSDVDIYVAKLTTGGKTLWAKRFGDNSAQAGKAIDFDANGNVYVGGFAAGSLDFGCEVHSTVGSDAFLVKFDAAGNCLWSDVYGGPHSDSVAALAVSKTDGSVYATGVYLDAPTFGGTALLDAGTTKNNLFVAKYSTGGAHVWSHGYGDSAIQFGNGIGLDYLDNVYVAGAFQGTLAMDAKSVAASTSQFDIFVAKLTAGAATWLVRAGTALKNDAASGIAVAPGSPSVSPSIFITGNYTGDCGGELPDSGTGSNALVMRHDAANGSIVWGRGFGDIASTLSDVGLAIATGPSGNPLATGSYRGTGSVGGFLLPNAGTTGTNVFVTELEAPTDKFLWSRGYGEKDRLKQGDAIAVDADGNVFVAGSTTGFIDFGTDSTTLTPVANRSIFVAKLSN